MIICSPADQTDQINAVLLVLACACLFLIAAAKVFLTNDSSLWFDLELGGCQWVYRG
jgi:hypothetical protein